MNLTQHHHRVISGRTCGTLASLERCVLSAAEVFYRLGVGYRNRAFDSGRYPSARLRVPIISIGNITAGGTGKTPAVIWLCRHLLAGGRKPAVLCRGYKARPGQANDEMQVIARHLPGLVCLGDPDRVGIGRLAIDQHGADVLVLDDGFQHRHLHRDLDIVLIDATCPFGYDRLLPRGLLREPLASLHRAHLILVTRSDQVGEAGLDALGRQLHHWVPQTPVIRCVHRPTGFVDLAGKDVPGVNAAAESTLLFAAIGNPEAFQQTVRRLGVQVTARRWWPDHHSYTQADVEALVALSRQHGATLLLTTEKDAVKLQHLAGGLPARTLAVRIDMDFSAADCQVLTDCVSRLLASGCSG